MIRSKTACQGMEHRTNHNSSERSIASHDKTITDNLTG